LAGLSTALALAEMGAEIGRDQPILVIERDLRVGGKAQTDRRGAYAFDVTGHWLHLRDERVRRLLARIMPAGDLVEIDRKTSIFTHGVMLPYPFQANLFGLPLPVVQRCLVEFIEAQRRALDPARPVPRTFEDFAIARFGRGIAEAFFIPYNTKVWGEHYPNLRPEAAARFVPIPEIEQVVGGAIGLRQDGLGYNARFLYPRTGGIDALPHALAMAARAAGVTFKLGAAVRGVDTGRRLVVLEDGTELPYAKLVSTMPLPDLVRRVVDASPEIRAAGSALRWVSWRYLNLGTRHRPPMQDHWVYVPDPGIPFFRVGVFSNAVSNMAPPGGGSLYVELTDRTHAPDLPAIYDALATMGAIISREDVDFVELRDIDCAYVVFDEAHERSTTTLHAWLQTHRIRSCGRYGAWVYQSMEDSIIAGMEAAEWVNQ